MTCEPSDDERLAQHRADRLEHGVSEWDSFDLHAYLAEVIANGAGLLRDRLIGTPHGMSEGEWEDVLDRIASGFLAWRIHDTQSVSPEPEVEAALDESFALLREHWLAMWD